jgi:hypothetical protein
MAKIAKKTAKEVEKKKGRVPVEPEPDDGGGDGGDDIGGQLDTMFGESWGSAEAKTFSDVPAGTYQTRVVAAPINNAKSSGRLQVSWEMVVLDGDQRARHLFKHDGLDTEESIGYFKGSLATLGYQEPTTKEELKETLDEIVAAPTYVVARVTNRKKKVNGMMVERTNTRFIRALDSADVTDDLDEDELESVITVNISDEMATNVTQEPGNDNPVDDSNTGSNEEPSCSLVDGVSVKSMEEKLIDKLAKKLGFNPDDYDTWESLLCEVGDYCGLSGVFKSVKDLLTKAQKAAA